MDGSSMGQAAAQLVTRNVESANQHHPLIAKAVFLNTPSSELYVSTIVPKVSTKILSIRNSQLASLVMTLV
jgi:hypothetical protein